MTGKLGLLLPIFPRADLIVAYRHLNGGTLDGSERKAYSPIYTYSEPGWDERWKEEERQDEMATAPLKGWIALHPSGSLKGFETEKEVEKEDQGHPYRFKFDNCYRDAFRTAVQTYKKRAAIWGEHSPELADWLKGQDTVFANCTGGSAHLPDSTPASAPALLNSDRAYQIAAAHFYAGDFNEARKEFEAIHQDAQSPWRGNGNMTARRRLEPVNSVRMQLSCSTRSRRSVGWSVPPNRISCPRNCANLSQ